MQHFIHVDAVVIPPSRQRREHNEVSHQELIASIQHGPAGLQNPIVLRIEGDNFVLVSGERRLRAVKEIYELGGELKYYSTLQAAWLPVDAGMIPYTPLGELDEISRMQAEYDENERRVNLTWQERAAATAALEALRNLERKRDGLPPVTTAQLAISARGADDGSAQQATRQELLLAKHLDDPVIGKASSRKEAFKLLLRKEETRRNGEMALAAGKIYSGEAHKVYNENCIEWMENRAPQQFDIILTDPPYGMGADEFGDSGHSSYGEHSYVDSYENWLELMPRLVEGITVHTKPNAHAYIFCDFDRFHQLKGWMVKASWKVFRTPMLWFKPSAYRAPWPQQGPQRKYECILFAVRGDKNCAVLGGDVLEFAPDENLGHEAQKPVALYRELLRRSAAPGDRVFDPCAGSGPIFPAAHDLKLVATGCEIDANHYGKCVERITKLKEVI